MANVAVLGAGSWGTALSLVLADNGYQVRLWTHSQKQADEINQTHLNKRYLDVVIPEEIKAFHDLKAAVQDVEALVIVVPTKAIREVAHQLNQVLKDKPILIHASKGIEPDTFKR